MARVFADTNVLFPFSIMDLLLALSEDMVHEVLWTERLLAEWQRVIDPDTYLCELFDEFPGEITETVVRMAAGKHRPPWTPEDLAHVLHEGSGPRPSVSADLAVLELLGLEQTKQTGAEPGGLAPGGELVEKPVRSGSPYR